ncbi:MAG: hypothetical protein LBD58_13370 [Treponema sp.]|nr:hypothetical protein [Treponema sp.]
MPQLMVNDVIEYVENNIAIFHERRIGRLDKLKLSEALKKKNPYLFKAKDILSAQEFVKTLVDTHISSSEEGVFGDWLEGLAVFINSKVYGGWKSGITGLDLEFDKDGTRNIVTIKSGPNWGNASQIKKMLSDFNTAKKTLRTSDSNLHVICINGCCYGQIRNPDKGSYFKYCGQQFREYISGDESVYIDIIEPLGYNAKKNEDFTVKYNAMLNKFTKDFIEEFCFASGDIDWNKIVELNSGKMHKGRPR